MIEQPQKPKPANTYWVHEHLLAGDYPGKKHHSYRPHTPFVEQLLALGVDCFFDLTEPHESDPLLQARQQAPLAPYSHLVAGKAEYRRFPIRDVSIPDREMTKGILDAMDEAIAAGHIVYVHCRGGVGRTGTIVGCHLVRKEKISGDQALKRLGQLWSTCVKSKWRDAPENLEQVEWVRHWQE